MLSVLPLRRIITPHGRAAVGGKGTPPAAPTLAMDPQWVTTQNVPRFSIESASTVGAGYSCHVQIQPTGGNWSSLTQDITHTIAQAESDADQFSFGFALLPNATYDARVALIAPGGVVSAWSNVVTFAVNLLQVPVNTVAPAITGDGSAPGNILTTTSTWSGTAPIALAYQWKTGAVAIGGATSQTYTIQVGDAGASLTCDVSGTNSQGGPITVTTPALVVGQVPANTVAPAISGLANVGQTLTCSQGTWTGGSISSTYQWKSGGTVLGSGNTYVVQPGDLGSTITCSVTASNGWGSALATSSGVTIVPPMVWNYGGGFHYTGSSSGLSTTMNLGASDATKYVVVAVAAQNTNTVSTVTINGVALSRLLPDVTSGAGGYSTEIWGGLVGTSGGSGSVPVVVAWANANGYQTRNMQVWYGTNLTNTAAPAASISKAGRYTVASGGASVSVQAGDYLIIVAPDNGVTTFTGSTQTPTDSATSLAGSPYLDGSDWSIAVTNAAFKVLPSVDRFLYGVSFR